MCETTGYSLRNLRFLIEKPMVFICEPLVFTCVTYGFYLRNLWFLLA